MKTLFCALVLALPLLRGATTDERAWKTLTDGIADEHAEKRLHAVAAFELLRPSRYTVSLVEGALSDKDVLVRQTAVETLGALKSRTSIPKLKPALEDESPEVSFSAARVLWDLGDRSGRDILEAVMARERKTTPGVVSGSMRDARSKLHNPAYLALLGARTGAGMAFGPVGFGFAMAEALMKDSGATARALSATLLAQDKSDESVEYIEDALGDKNWAVRAAVLKALAVSGRKAAIPKIEPVLEDKRDEVRYIAAAAIVRLSDRRITAPKPPPRAPRALPAKQSRPTAGNDTLAFQGTQFTLSGRKEVRMNPLASRRHFLGLAGVTATALGPRAEAAPASESPISKLKSRAGEARPITVEERRERIERARRRMRENQLDAICMIGGTSLVYFSNIRWWNSERLFFMVLPARGEPFYISPAFEEERAREQIATGPGGTDAHVITWQEDDDPYALLAAGLKERGLASGKIGVEEKTFFVFADGLAKAAPALTVSSATPVTAGCRMIKSPHEIELMRLASKITLQAYRAAWQSLREGMTQREFANLVQSAHKQLGFEGGAGVQVAAYSANPHGSVKPQVIREGTILLIDGGCTVEGYESDISRTFVLGKATDKMKRVFDIVHHAQSAALAAARPGVPCGDVDAAARKVIVDAGFGPGYKYFTHRLGHGMGMDGHEWPYLVRGNNLPLAAGMTFSDEPGIYIKGEFGVRLEDDMLITQNSAELLTPQSPSLEQPFSV